MNDWLEPVLYGAGLGTSAYWLVRLIPRRLSLSPRRKAGGCRHLRVARVETSNDVVAHICLDCDADLPQDFASPAS